MGIKIQTTIVDGEQRIPEICMKLLMDFAGHSDVCDQCHQARKNQTLDYCITGSMILQELSSQPEVSSI